MMRACVCLLVFKRGQQRTESSERRESKERIYICRRDPFAETDKCANSVIPSRSPDAVVVVDGDMMMYHTTAVHHIYLHNNNKHLKK